MDRFVRACVIDEDPLIATVLHLELARDWRIIPCRHDLVAEELPHRLNDMLFFLFFEELRWCLVAQQFRDVFPSSACPALIHYRMSDRLWRLVTELRLLVVLGRWRGVPILLS